MAAEPAKSMINRSTTPPAGAWPGMNDSTDYAGGAFLTVGGSNPAEGHNPVDDPRPSSSVSPSDFWNLQTNPNGSKLS